MLKKCKESLTKNGKIIIAIENRLGLKYWSGFCEDHLGKRFAGLEGYETSSFVQTFSKAELRRLLESNELKNIDWYYTYPDYKFPLQIFSDTFEKAADNLCYACESYDTDQTIFFDPGKVWASIGNDYFDIFANSFLVVCGE